MTLRAILVLSAVLLTGCAGTRIGRINADPSRYANRMVTVSGQVTNSVGVLGTGGYQLEDESGRIYVISRSGVPSRGSRVKVTGTVTPGVTVLGQAVGVAIREDHHSVK
jgi:hypothetical protein